MDISNFTDKSKAILSNASNIAIRNRNAQVTDFHLMFAFLEDSQGLVCVLLSKMQVDIDALKNSIQNEIDGFPKISGPVALSFSNEAAAILDESQKQCENMKDQYISVEHF